jgi:hypothetical protein
VPLTDSDIHVLLERYPSLNRPETFKILSDVFVNEEKDFNEALSNRNILQRAREIAIERAAQHSTNLLTGDDPQSSYSDAMRQQLTIDAYGDVMPQDPNKTMEDVWNSAREMHLIETYAPEGAWGKLTSALTAGLGSVARAIPTGLTPGGHAAALQSQVARDIGISGDTGLANLGELGKMVHFSMGELGLKEQWDPAMLKVIDHAATISAQQSEWTKWPHDIAAAAAFISMAGVLGAPLAGGTGLVSQTAGFAGASFLGEPGDLAQRGKAALFGGIVAVPLARIGTRFTVEPLIRALQSGVQKTIGISAPGLSRFLVQRALPSVMNAMSHNAAYTASAMGHSLLEGGDAWEEFNFAKAYWHNMAIMGFFSGLGGLKTEGTAAWRKAQGKLIQRPDQFRAGLRARKAQGAFEAVQAREGAKQSRGMIHSVIKHLRFEKGYSANDIHIGRIMAEQGRLLTKTQAQKLARRPEVQQSIAASDTNIRHMAKAEFDRWLDRNPEIFKTKDAIGTDLEVADPTELIRADPDTVTLTNPELMLGRNQRERIQVLLQKREMIRRGYNRAVRATRKHMLDGTERAIRFVGEERVAALQAELKSLNETIETLESAGHVEGRPRTRWESRKAEIEEGRGYVRESPSRGAYGRWTSSVPASCPWRLAPSTRRSPGH